VRAAAQVGSSETVTQYAERWIAERKLSPRSREGYESNLRLHIKPTPLGAVPISSLTAPMVRTWHAGLDKKYPTRNAHCYSLLHAICETAVTPDELLPINPAPSRAPCTRRPNANRSSSASASWPRWRRPSSPSG
jgi:hypothetical protein